MSIDIYTRILTYKETQTKSIYLVKNEIDGLFYIERRVGLKNKNIYEIIRNIHSLHIPKIYEIIEEHESLIIIEEYVNARTLDKYIINNELNDSDKDKIILQLLDAVSLLHEKNIVHRDIKPENIFYDGNHIKLFDFDISRIHNENQNKDTTILGSIGYAAPEQFGFKQTDERTDIYALGVLINVLMTSHLPNEMIVEGVYRKIVERATHIDPEHRYKNILMMKKDLGESDSYDWTLPGFRRNKLLHKVIAVIGYALIIFLVVISEYEGIKKWSVEEIINKMLLLIIMFSTVCYCTNYRNICQYSLFHNNPNKIIRFIGNVLTMVMLWMAILFIGALFMPTT